MFLKFLSVNHMTEHSAGRSDMGSALEILKVRVNKIVRKCYCNLTPINRSIKDRIENLLS